MISEAELNLMVPAVALPGRWAVFPVGRTSPVTALITSMPLAAMVGVMVMLAKVPSVVMVVLAISMLPSRAWVLEISPST